jgi:hypothetical protein
MTFATFFCLSMIRCSGDLLQMPRHESKLPGWALSRTRPQSPSGAILPVCGAGSAHVLPFYNTGKLLSDLNVPSDQAS